MFDNIGGKIKTLASVVAWLGIISSIITGIILMATAEEMAFTGIIIAIVGSIGSWTGSFLLYGFGELVDNSAIIAKKLNNNTSKPKQAIPFENEEFATQKRREPLHKWNGKCEMCDTDNVMITAAVIADDLGTRHRNVCENCFKRYNCTFERK